MSDTVIQWIYIDAVKIGVHFHGLIFQLHKNIECADPVLSIYLPR